MNNLSEMEAALVQSLASSSAEQERRLDELASRLAQLTEQLQESRSALATVTRERDQLQQALTECQRSLAGDELVPLPCDVVGEKEWFRPSAYKRYRITASFEDERIATDSSGKPIPKMDSKTEKPVLTIRRREDGIMESVPVYASEPTGRGKMQILYLDGERICEATVAEMAIVEAALHRALNPFPKQ